MTQRDRFASCPHCEDRSLEPTPNETRLECAGCGGVLVDHRALLAAIVTTIPAGLEPSRELVFDAPTIVEAEITCPRCTSAMSKRSLYGIQIDRCEAHGVWFGGDELQAMLEKANLVNVAAADGFARALVRFGLNGVLAAGIVRWLRGG